MFGLWFGERNRRTVESTRGDFKTMAHVQQLKNYVDVPSAYVT